MTGDNALLLTTFALAFSPVNPLSVAACAALRVSFPGACPGKDGSIIWTKRQIKTGTTTLSCSLRSPSRFPPLTPFLSPRARLSGCLFTAHVREKTDLLFGRRDNILAAHTLARMFSLRATLSFSRCVFAERKRIYYKKVCGAASAKVNLL